MTSVMKTAYLDIETNTKHDVIWCCCVLIEGEDDVKVCTNNEQLVSVLGGVDTLVAHNGISFDFPVLARVWGFTGKDFKQVDSLVLSRLASPSRDNGHSLKSWGIRLGLHKGDFTDFDGGLTPEMVEYCKQDVRVLKRVHETLMTELKHFSQKSIDLERQVAEIINEQVDNGFAVDVRKLMTYIAELSDRQQELHGQLVHVFEPNYVQLKTKTKIVPFNPGSRQQIADRLIKRGWNPKQHTEKGNVIIDEGTLSKIDIPEVKLLQEYLLVQKRLAQAKSWMEAVGDDDRVHGSVITIGAVTGRMTHSSPNMAQIPAARSPYGEICRSIWTADKGHMLVGADLSGIELRCFAHYLNDSDYTNEIVNGDVHTRNQHLFGVATRDQAKTILYAGLYGASPAKLASIVGGSAKDGDRLRQGFNNIPGYKKLTDKIANLAARGYLPGLDGRRLIVRSAHSALNLLLQGAGAVIFKQWLVVQKDYLTSAGIVYKLVASVHDEVQLSVEKERADEAGKLIIQAAADAGTLLGLRCPVAAEYKTGLSWYDCH